MRFWPRSSGAGGALWVNCRHGAPEYQFKPAEIEQLPFHFTFFYFCLCAFTVLKIGDMEPWKINSSLTCFFLDLICFFGVCAIRFLEL